MSHRGRPPLNRPCSVRGCPAKHFQHGFCQQHHKSLYCSKAGGGHTPKPWTVTPSESGRQFAVCRYCEKPFVVQESPASAKVPSSQPHGKADE